MTTVVRVEDVSKRFVIHKDKSLKERVVNFSRSHKHKDDFWALRGVSLDIKSGTTVGLAGHNGSGKSTLLKLISGILLPTAGSVTRRGNLAALIELGAGFHPDLTGRENVFLNCALLGLNRAEAERQYDSIVDFASIEQFMETQVKFYSSGMYMRLAFAVAVHVDPDVLLVDEVLAVGDEPFQRKCMDRIRSFQREGRTIVIVSHALEQLGELCDRVVVLNHGRIEADDEAITALRTLRADFELARQEERERERERATVTVTSAPPTRARVTSVRLNDLGEGQLATIKPGDGVTVHITLTADEQLSDWILGTGIDQPGGQVVWGTHSKMLGLQMPKFTGTREFSVNIPELWLAEGQYFVHAAIADLSGVEIDRMRDAAVLQVQADGLGVGVLYVLPTIDLE